MKYLSSVLNCIFTFIFFCSFLPQNLYTVFAWNDNTHTKLTQTILPVRLIYLNDYSDVVKIWNNVKSNDDKFILKFIYLKNDEEITINDELILKYSKLLSTYNLMEFGWVNLGGNQLDQGTFNVQVLNLNSNLVEIRTFF
jgi:hypothetical protein